MPMNMKSLSLELNNSTPITVILIIAILFIANTQQACSQNMKEGIFSTEYTYELPDYSGKSFTPIMTLCHDKDSEMYYHMSNIADFSEEHIVMWTGSLEETRAIYEGLDSLIKKLDYNGTEQIKDMRGNVFIVSAPLIKDHMGRYLRIQPENKEVWGIISKQHLKNFKRVFK